MANVGVRPSSGFRRLGEAGEVAVDELALQRDGGRGDDDRGVLLDGVVDRGHQVGQRLAGAGARLHGHVLAGGDRRAHGLRHRVLAFPAGAPDGGDGGFEELADPGELGGRHGSEATGCPRPSGSERGQRLTRANRRTRRPTPSCRPGAGSTRAAARAPRRSARRGRAPRPPAGGTGVARRVASHTSTRTNSWPSRSVTRSGGRACSTALVSSSVTTSRVGSAASPCTSHSVRTAVACVRVAGRSLGIGCASHAVVQLGPSMRGSSTALQRAGRLCRGHPPAAAGAQPDHEREHGGRQRDRHRHRGERGRDERQQEDTREHRRDDHKSKAATGRHRGHPFGQIG